MNETNTNLITSVKDALTEAIKTIATAQKALLNQANTEKANLLALLNEIRGTRDTISIFGDVCAEAGEALLDTAEFCDGITDKIFYVIDGNHDVPVADYENFVEFCDQCGKEIVVGDEFGVEGGDYTCAECAAALEAMSAEETADEDEDEESDASDEVVAE